MLRLNMSSQTAFVATFCFFMYLAHRYHRRRHLPPGPTMWPIIGNTFIIPLTNVHKFYKDLGRKIGWFLHVYKLTHILICVAYIGSKIMYLEALGQSIIVINDITIAQDLLDKRSTIYSSRWVDLRHHPPKLRSYRHKVLIFLCLQTCE